MVEAFRGPPGLNRGIVEARVKDSTKFVDLSMRTDKEIMNLENKANKAVKGANLISKADKQRFGKLTDKLQIIICWGPQYV
jgi:hypothetical protein